MNPIYITSLFLGAVQLLLAPLLSPWQFRPFLLLPSQQAWGQLLLLLVLPRLELQLFLLSPGREDKQIVCKTMSSSRRFSSKLYLSLRRPNVSEDFCARLLQVI